MMFAIDNKLLRAWDKTGVFVPRFTGAEMLHIGFRTDPDVVKQLLPKPLEAPDEPLATAFVARYPETNFGVSYNEGALFVRARFKNELGSYCLAMPVDDDMAMVGGREIHGFPKKIADEITLEHEGERVIGRVVRKGDEIMHLEADATEPTTMEGLNAPTTTDPDGEPAVLGVTYLFKHVPSTTGRGFEHNPRLIRQPTLFRPRPGLRTGAAKLQLGSGAADDLGALPVGEIDHVVYGVFDAAMLPGRVLATVRNPLRFAPYAFFSTDFMAVNDPSTRPALSRRARRRLRKRLAEY